MRAEGTKVLFNDPASSQPGEESLQAFISKLEQLARGRIELVRRIRAADSVPVSPLPRRFHSCVRSGRIMQVPPLLRALASPGILCLDGRKPGGKNIRCLGPVVRILSGGMP